MKRVAVYAVLLLVALILAFAWFGSRNRGKSVGSITSDHYLVAAQPMEAGKFIKSSAVSWESLSRADVERLGLNPSELIADNSKNREIVQNSVPLSTVEQGKYVRAADLAGPADPEFLPSVLKPGYRAVAIKVNDVTGGAGLYRPGNYVDVLLTKEEESRYTNNRTGAVTKTILQNVRVLAVNKDLGRGAAEADQKQSSRASREGTVSLEVLPRDAEVLALGGSLGEISLALCSSTPGAEASRVGLETRASDILPVEQKAAAKAEAKPKVVKRLYGASQSQQVVE